MKGKYLINLRWYEQLLDADLPSTNNVRIFTKDVYTLLWYPSSDTIVISTKDSELFRGRIENKHRLAETLKSIGIRKRRFGRVKRK